MNDNVYGAVIVTATAKVHPVHLMNIARAAGGRRPLDQANQLEPLAAKVHVLHSQLPLITA